MRDHDKVLVALSGGVDSAYAAWLLLREGYELEGVCLYMYEGSAAPSEAREVAGKLGIPLRVIDVKERFSREVVDDFRRVYNQGMTPNPCVICNPLVKFDALQKAADESGAKYIATGHYARIGSAPDGDRRLLLRARDVKKDQSYFLYRLSREILRRVIFPLGELTKEETRAGAGSAGLSAAKKKDSQEICFIPDGDYQSFLRGRGFEESGGDSGGVSGGKKPGIKAFGTATGMAAGTAAGMAAGMAAGLIPGDFVDRDGNKLGRHKGFACYTIGQRKRLGLSLGSVMYALELRPELNQVVLGPESALYRAGAVLADCVFISGAPPLKPIQVSVKLRAGAEPVAATFIPSTDKTSKRDATSQEVSGRTDGIAGAGSLIFDKPQKAVTPGQSAVFYIGDQALGGGIIQSPVLT